MGRTTRRLVLTKTDDQSGISERLFLVNGVAGEGDTLMCLHRPINYCSIAQLVEHRTVNPFVPGSSPG